jgi:hypothetical protein
MSYNSSLHIGLRKEEPRAGKRKPVEESEDEEEQKKVTKYLFDLIELLIE